MVEIWFIDSYGDRRRGIHKNCQRCLLQFSDRLEGKKKYCSRTCRDLDQQRSKLFKCSTCDKEFNAKPSREGKSKHGFYFCSKLCQDNGRKLNSGVVMIRPPHYGAGNGSQSYRSRCENELKLGCLCGENREFLMFVHHIDGNRENNEKSNLEIVCCNCHVLRHLKMVDGKWKYDSHCLTPRESLKEFYSGGNAKVAEILCTDFAADSISAPSI